MYYTFGTTIDMKKEGSITNDAVTITIPFFDVVVESNDEITEQQLATIKNKIAAMMTNKFNIASGNFIVDLKSVIK